MSVDITVSDRTFAILDDIAKERKRQDDKWGPQRAVENIIPQFAYAINGAEYYKAVEHERAKYGHSTWTDILLKEVAEAIDEAKAGDIDSLRRELIQVAAVAVCWIENLPQTWVRK